jgi:CDP-glycerol glycerophosphotransferase
MMPPSRTRALVSRGRQLASRVRGRVAARKLPIVSVVVTAKASQAPFLVECLESVLVRQTWHRVEVLLVPFGGDSQPVRNRAHSLLEAERRLALVEAPEARTLGAARNAGVARATGEFVVFVGGADIVPHAALGRLVTSLQESGSDFARGVVHVDRARAGDVLPGSRLSPVTHASLEEMPLAMSDFFVEGTLFRKTFWSGRTFPDADGPELEVSVARAYLDAAAFDVVAEPGYRFMNRGSGRVVGLERNELEDLDTWLTAQDQIRDLLEGASDAVRYAWLTGVIGTGMQALLEDAEQATPDQWVRLRDTVQGMLALGGPGLMEQVAVVPRLYAWLTTRDRRDDLEDLVADRRFLRNDFPTVVEDGVVYAQLPFFRGSGDPVPDELFVLGEWETPLAASLRNIRWQDDGILELDVYALIRYVPMEHEPPRLTVRLVDPVSGRSVTPTIRQSVDSGVTRFGAMRWQNADQGAVTLVLDAAELALIGPDEDRVAWQIEIELTTAGVTRRGVVDHRLQAGAAGVPRPRTVAGRVIALPNGAGPVAVSVVTPVATLVEAHVAGRTVSGVLTLPGSTPGQVVARRGHLRVAVPLRETASGHGFELELPAGRRTPTEPEDRVWNLRVESSAGAHAIAWPDSDEAWMCEGPASDLAVHRTPRGNVEVMETRGLAQVDAVVLEETSLIVRGSWLGVPLQRWGVTLQGPRLRLPGEVVSHDDRGHFEARVPLMIDEWGKGATFVPSGIHRIVLSGASSTADDDRALMIGPTFEAQLPLDQRNDSFRTRCGRGAAGRPFIRLQKPYTDDEVGPYAQQTLRAAYAVSSPPIDENAVYLQSYDGQTATDSPLAIHEQLRRTHPHLTLYWGVADRATVLPDGAVPLLTYTREWYEVLARVKYLVNNVDFERWFARKPGQQMLQTFHGYPSKSMGIRMWEAKNFTPRRIAAELDRTSRDWDLILTPAPEMDQYYRTEYAYGGPIHSHGYPRDDILVSERAADVRTRTRNLLGIQDHQTAVLYAPTWRDDLATTYRSSPLVRHLDLEASSQALGDDYVLLMRGHRFHPGQERASGNARLIDVTHYPEINDLILATDAAVLDYSSLRFDIALTWRPMLFLVPDLEHYSGGARGFLYPFEDSAPGPLIQSADEVVELLRDLDKVREDHRDAYRKFNETYNYLQDGTSTEHVVAAFFDQGLRATTT